MATSTRQIAIWILEALKEERKRQPDFMKCRHEGEVLTPLREQHQLVNADISDGLSFLNRRKLLHIYLLPDTSRVAWISDDGLEYLEDYHSAIEADRIYQERETEKAKTMQERESEHSLWVYWRLADWGERFGMVSFLFAVFLIGYLSASNNFISRIIALIRDIKP
jgi:hypothetical protein